jgi:hypothetical protein
MGELGIKSRGFWNWVDDRHLPLDTEALERVLFGKSTAFNRERLELQDRLRVTRAKNAAKAALRAKSAGRGSRPGLPMVPDTYGENDDDDEVTDVDDTADSESNGNDVVVWHMFDDNPFGPNGSNEDLATKGRNLVPLEPFRAYRLGRRAKHAPHRRGRVLTVLVLALLAALYLWSRQQPSSDGTKDYQTANAPVTPPAVDSPAADIHTQTDAAKAVENERLNAERDRIAAEKTKEIQQAAAERDRIAAERAAEVDRAAKADRDRIAAEKAAEVERAAKAERDRIAAEKAAEVERAAKAERDRVAAEKAAEVERAAKAERDRVAAEKAAEVERAAKSERDRVAAEKAAAEVERAENAERERIAADKVEADRIKDEQEKLAADRARQNAPAPSLPPAAPSQGKDQMLPPDEKSIDKRIEEARRAALVKEAVEAGLRDQLRVGRRMETNNAIQRNNRNTQEIAAMGFTVTERTSMTGESVGMVYANSVFNCALKCLEDNNCNAYAFNDYGKTALPDGKSYFCYRFKKGNPFANEYYTSGQRLAPPIPRNRRGDPGSGSSPLAATSEASNWNPLIWSTPIAQRRVFPPSSAPADGQGCGNTKVTVRGFTLDCDVKLTGGGPVGVQELKQTSVSIGDCASKCEPFRGCVGFTYDSAALPDDRHYCQLFGGDPEKQSSAKGWISGRR